MLIENISEVARDAKAIWLGNAQFHNLSGYVWSDYTPFDFENWEYTGMNMILYEAKEARQLSHIFSQYTDMPIVVECAIMQFKLVS